MLPAAAPRHSLRPVSYAPLFSDPTVPHTKDRYLVHADALSRGSQVKERCRVYTRRYVPADGFVALNDDVLDGLSPVGKGSTDKLDCLSDPAVALQIAERRPLGEVADK